MTATTVNSHTEEYRRAQQRVLKGSDLLARWIDVGGERVQVLERGRGQAVVVLHGTGSGAPFLRPLLDRLEGVRVIAPDRPGQGLSAPIDITRDRFRDDAVAWVDRLLDALDIEHVTLVGHSMGGLWASWYALEHPTRVTRLVLLAPPQLPGTRCPLPFRVMGTPGLFGLFQRMSPPSPASALRFAKMMGEADSLPGHPDLVDLMAAAGNDSTTRRTNVNEARTIVSPLALVSRTGFRRDMRVRADELRRVEMPTLLIWGDREPLGSVAVAQKIVDVMGDARLETVPTGHAPWIGQPDLTARLVNRFLRAGAPDG